MTRPETESLGQLSPDYPMVDLARIALARAQSKDVAVIASALHEAVIAITNEWHKNGGWLTAELEKHLRVHPIIRLYSFALRSETHDSSDSWTRARFQVEQLAELEEEEEKETLTVWYPKPKSERKRRK